MYFVVMPRVSLIVILVMYVCYLYSINCPTVICLPSMLYLSYGETPLVSYGPRSNFLYIALPFYYYSLGLLSCITIILLPLDTLIPLFTAKRWDWQPHRKLGEKYLFVLCRFHVVAGWRHADKQFIWRPCSECHEASKHHLLKFGFLLLVRFYLGFITEGRLATVLIIPSSWGSQRAVLTVCIENKRGTQLAQSQSVPGRPLLASIYRWPGLKDPVGFNTNYNVNIRYYLVFQLYLYLGLT
jgi:hypothetical protein